MAKKSLYFSPSMVKELNSLPTGDLEEAIISLFAYASSNQDDLDYFSTSIGRVIYLLLKEKVIREGGDDE